MSHSFFSGTFFRAALLFLCCWLGIAIFAGSKSLTRPSSNAHFSYLADAWLGGRLSIEGKPPGYCTSELRRAGKCRHHRYDDWAVVWTLELKDGRSLRAFPCKTKECDEKKRKERVETWFEASWPLKTVELPLGSIRSRQDTWYVSFPPGPALFFLPFVWLWGLGVWDVFLTSIVGALIPALIYYRLRKNRSTATPKAKTEFLPLLLALAWVFASPALFLASHGSVWFTAQIFASLFLFAFLFSVQAQEKAWISGLWLALAMSCRPHLILAGVYFLYTSYRAHKTPSKSAEGSGVIKELLSFAAPILVIGTLLALHNHLRFENPFEFGHRFLDIRWQGRIQSQGLFSFEYLGRNLRCLLTLSPITTETFPFFKVSLHGSNILLGAPWLLLGLLFLRHTNGEQRVLFATAALLALPALFYQNSGQMQFSYRFALDWLPLVLVAFASSKLRQRVKIALLILILFGSLYQGIGAWYFGRKPGHIFVTQPMGWPFEDELKAN